MVSIHGEMKGEPRLASPEMFHTVENSCYRDFKKMKQDVMVVAQVRHQLLHHEGQLAVPSLGGLPGHSH